MHVVHLSRVAITLCTLLTFFAKGSYAQNSTKPFSNVDGFFVEYTPGPPPLSVSCGVIMSQSSSESPLSFTWTFEEGVQSYGAYSSHMYLVPGEYTVKLVIIDAQGNKLEFEKTVQIGDAEEEMPLLLPIMGYRSMPREKNLLAHPLLPRRDALCILE